MKILRLSFKNLNSLAGGWAIDFTHPDYVSGGIFAITGPTGAGKSTILDAVCLALYGQTPRLGRITQTENEIMARQTGECFSEVEFATARGHFRCHWSQHRSRRHPDGPLQLPRHEIVEAASGKVLESKLKAVATMVEEVTGMDFDRFTRSMLLAQGSFAAFLQARPDERAPILEQITGTAIYSRISIKVHERTAEERKRLDRMQSDLAGIQLLTPPEEEALNARTSELRQTESVLATEAHGIREARLWLERIALLEGELQQLEQERLAFEERLAAAGPELEQLALASRALQLGSDHARILEIRKQQAGDQVELTAATQRLPRLQQELQAAVTALELAEQGRQQVQAEQAHEAELIRKTRELDVRLGETGTRLQELAGEIDALTGLDAGYRLAITVCEQRTHGVKEELERATAYLAEHQSDAALTGTLAGLEQQIKQLKACDRECSDLVGAMVELTNGIESATHRFGQIEAIWQAADEAVSEAEQQQAAAGEAFAAMLQGSALPAWRDRAEALAQRLSRLEAVLETLTRMAETQSKLALLGENLAELDRKQQSLSRQEEALARESELGERLVRQLQETVILLNRVKSLEEERKQLVDGTPCPLCGASEHPYAAGNTPQPDETQQELAQASAKAAQVRDQLGQVRQQLAVAAENRQRCVRDQSECREKLAQNEAICADTLSGLGLQVSGEDRLPAARRKQETDREELAELRTAIREMERLEQAERTAQATLAWLKEERADHDKARLAARLALETARAEYTRLEGEAAGNRAELDRLLADIGKGIAAYGYVGIAPDRADELLAALDARSRAYGERAAARERLARDMADSAAEREKQQALLAETTRARNDKEQQFRELGTTRDALAHDRRELYGERDPDSEERRLAEALRLADKQRDAALGERNRLQSDLAGLNERIERLSHTLSRRGDELAAEEAALGQRLEQGGFADEAALKRACLPRERFDTLSQLDRHLRQEKISLATRLQDRREALDTEQRRHLTDKPLEQVREENSVADARLGEVQRELGGIEQSLRQHAAEQERHGAQAEAIDRQRRECERWERLHSLIGSGDGKKFRNFAQGLTFELMVAHANRQLQKMSDRYILVRDSNEPLELNVIDNYQAGEVRSTKNLSGGESFIASLALSLGLSGMASRTVAVDSLFLDEGFGTLDEDALETALETLGALQQDGKLIGIISHVPALKERIGTQIQVEAGNSGRSTLSGPGCRRIP